VGDEIWTPLTYKTKPVWSGRLGELCPESLRGK
jgi:hypothetical protein